MVSLHSSVGAEGCGLTNTAHSVLSGRRILIAEDEGLIAVELESTLQSFGCEVVGPVSSVEDVMRHVDQNRPDGALLDVNLRGEKIFRILPRLAELGVPVVISSGYDDPKAFPSEFRDLPRISKPFDDAALRRVCEATFAKP
jgi:DNA-binding NtrC family response regulator